ncbi:MAG: methyltransferase domain-containing protein [Gemmatimonadaceae bacterium]|nr:methyltransferase domain-containing protein [Gemmatimonadaceae bacterium]
MSPTSSGSVPSSDYRARIYEYYASARHEALVCGDRGALASRAPYVRAMIRRHFPRDRGAVIMDLGCGHGTIVHFAREAGYRNVVGIDRSPEQVAEARRLGIEGVEQGDLMESLAARPACSVDVVLTFDVIEHLTRGELLPLVDGVHRVLRDGGRWIIHAPNAESPFFGRIRYGDVTHEQAFTRTSIGQLLFSSGFRTVACFEDAPIVHGVASAARFAIWYVIRGALRLYLAAETGRLREPAIFSQNFLTVAEK